MKRQLEDGTYKFWDIIIKSITSFLTILTIALAFNTYLDNQKTEIKIKEKEFRKEMALRQINYYSEISESIGKLLTVLSYRDSIFTKTYYQKKDVFYDLYYGKMNLIESQKVDIKLQSFHRFLEKYEAYDSDITIHKLRKAAFEVNDEFRASIRQTYDVNIDNLTK